MAMATGGTTAWIECGCAAVPEGAIFSPNASPRVAPVVGGGYKAVDAATMLHCGKSGIFEPRAVSKTVQHWKTRGR
jgi:hypothetical protein